jgi:hypothetical protein
LLPALAQFAFVNAIDTQAPGFSDLFRRAIHTETVVVPRIADKMDEGTVATI